MEITVITADALQYSCSALVVGCFEGGTHRSPLLKELNELLGGLLDVLDEQREFIGNLNKTRLIYTLGKLPAERILLVGLGKMEDLTGERLRQAGGSAVQAARAHGLGRITSVLHLSGENVDGALQAAVEGMILGNYTFTRYMSKGKEEQPLEGLVVLLSDQAVVEESKQLIDKTRIVCEAALFARDLVSQPGNVANPSYLAEQAQGLADTCGITCRVIERGEMERLGMGALLAVAKGSQQAPKFVILEHKGNPTGKTVVLVGKGVTFDSGGISLKPREGMEKMKSDMAGAAAVMATLRAVAQLRLTVNVVGLLPCVENLPSGTSYKPGDLVTSMSGRSIEIVNTDAEGRLILCDALSFAQEYKPSALIDIATLTGACLVALGTIATGLMGNDEALKTALKNAGEATWERVWELPLWEEYGELMKSDVAELKNAGGPNAGTISAAWFLQQFVGRTPWAHLDIAGTAWEDKGRPYLPKGATGVGVRLLVEYLQRLSA